LLNAIGSHLQPDFLLPLPSVLRPDRAPPQFDSSALSRVPTFPTIPGPSPLPHFLFSFPHPLPPGDRICPRNRGHASIDPPLFYHPKTLFSLFVHRVPGSIPDGGSTLLCFECQRSLVRFFYAGALGQEVTYVAVIGFSSPVGYATFLWHECIFYTVTRTLTIDSFAATLSRPHSSSRKQNRSPLCFFF